MNAIRVRRPWQLTAAAALLASLALAPRPEAAEPANGEQTPPAPPAESTPPRDGERNGDAERGPESAPEPAPGERVSADNNISFPVDI